MEDGIPLTEELELMPGGTELAKKAFVAFVEKQCDAVFNEVDHDVSGKLDSAELHIAVLLVYERMNHVLGAMALKVPSASAVKQLLRETGGSDGKLDRQEFREMFVRIFAPRVAAKATAHVLTSKVITPAAAAALNVMVSELHLSKKMQKLLRGRNPGFNVNRLLAKQVKGAVTKKIVSNFGRAFGPIVNYKLATVAAKKLHIEKGLTSVLDGSLRKRGKRAQAQSTSEPSDDEEEDDL